MVETTGRRPGVRETDQPTLSDPWSRHVHTAMRAASPTRTCVGDWGWLGLAGTGWVQILAACDVFLRCVLQIP